jgi:hypothetical protein
MFCLSNRISQTALYRVNTINSIAFGARFIRAHGRFSFKNALFLDLLTQAKKQGLGHNKRIL